MEIFFTKQFKKSSYKQMLTAVIKAVDKSFITPAGWRSFLKIISGHSGKDPLYIPPAGSLCYSALIHRLHLLCLNSGYTVQLATPAHSHWLFYFMSLLLRYTSVKPNR